MFFLDQGQPPRALAAVEEALRIWPGDPRAWVIKGRAQGAAVVSSEFGDRCLAAVEAPPLLAAERVRGFVLQDACRYYEFRGRAMDIHIDADARCWVATADARKVATTTTAFGMIPETRALMSMNFSRPRSLPKPASVMT